MAPSQATRLTIALIVAAAHIIFNLDISFSLSQKANSPDELNSRGIKCLCMEHAVKNKKVPKRLGEVVKYLSLTDKEASGALQKDRKQVIP